MAHLTGEDVLKDSIGKKILWVGEDPDEEGDVLVVFEDFSGFSVCGDDVVALEKGADAVKAVIDKRIKSAEGIMKLREHLDKHVAAQAKPAAEAPKQEAPSGTAGDQAASAPAAGA
jgi:hypothetical protein